MHKLLRTNCKSTPSLEIAQGLLHSLLALINDDAGIASLVVLEPAGALIQKELAHVGMGELLEPFLLTVGVIQLGAGLANDKRQVVRRRERAVEVPVD